MSLIDTVTPEAFFAEFLVPLKRAAQRQRASYFPHGRDDSRQSFWEPVVSRTGGLAQLPLDGTDADLLSALEAFWTSRNEPMLARIVPDLKVLQDAIIEGRSALETEHHEVSEFVYPLF